jgi:hypothetical protein
MRHYIGVDCPLGKAHGEAVDHEFDKQLTLLLTLRVEQSKLPDETPIDPGMEILPLAEISPFIDA